MFFVYNMYMIKLEIKKLNTFYCMQIKKVYYSRM